MSDEKPLRSALESAVPDPPSAREWGPDSRALSRRLRRRRVGVVVATVTVAVLAVPAVHAISGSHTPPVTNGPTVHGTGRAACQEVVRSSNGGQAVDTRVVDGATAAAWLHGRGADSEASQVADAPRVTVCVTSAQRSYSVVVTRPGHPSLVLARGDYEATVDTMKALDQSWKGGATTTEAPFRCPGQFATPAAGVSTSLPLGATGARLCYGGYFYEPRQVLKTGVDDLVSAINASPISYATPTFNCSGDGYPYTIVFDYPTGTRTASEDTCRGLVLGPFVRQGVTGLDTTFLSMLQRQEAGHAPTAAPPCPDPSVDAPAGTGDLRHLVAARYCAPGASGPGTLLVGTDLTRLKEWGGSLEAASTAIEGPCVRPAAGWPQLTLADVWGNAFTLTVECHHRLYPVVRSVNAPRQLTYPLGDNRLFERLARQLAAG